MNFSGSWNFSGQFQKNPSSSTECVLIYDGEKYILERVDGFGRNLKGNKGDSLFRSDSIFWLPTDTSSSPAPPMNLVKAKKLQTSSQDNTQSEKPETGAKLPKREPRKRKRSGSSPPRLCVSGHYVLFLVVRLYGVKLHYSQLHILKSYLQTNTLTHTHTLTHSQRERESERAREKNEQGISFLWVKRSVSERYFLCVCIRIRFCASVFLHISFLHRQAFAGSIIFWGLCRWNDKKSY